MKILKITFLNINSLREKTTIDFQASPLSDVGLFAITGDTGAGKTTILDAMTLALYGKVHRNKSVEEVMSYGTAESLAEVEFETASGRYLASWGIRLARKKIGGKVQDAKRGLAEWEEETKAYRSIAEKKTLVDKKIIEISGLDFNRFCRSVLLAQGDFAAFLKAKEGDRSALLERITGTEIYSELSKAAFEKFKEEERSLELLKSNIGGVDILSADEVEALVKQEEAKNEETKSLKKTLDALRKKAQAFLQIKTLTARQIELESAEKALQNEQEIIKDDVHRVVLFEEIQTLLPALQNLENSEQKLQNYHDEWQKNVKQLPQLAAQKEAAEKIYKEAESNWNLIEVERKKQAPLFEKVLEKDNFIAKESQLLAQLVDAYQKVSIEAQKKVKEIEELSASIQQKEVTLIKGDEWLAAHSIRKELVDDLPQIQLLFEQKSQLQSVVLPVKEAIEKTKAELTKKQAKIKVENIAFDKIEEKYLAHQKESKNLAKKLSIDLNENTTQVLDQQISAISNIASLQEEQANKEKTKNDLVLNSASLVSRLQVLVDDFKKVETELKYTNTQLQKAESDEIYKEKVYSQQQKIVAYEQDRANLKEGENCPLCLTEVHDIQHHVEPFVDQAKAQYEEAKTVRKKLQTKSEKYKVELQEIATKKALLEKEQIPKIKQEITALEATINAIVTQLETYGTLGQNRDHLAQKERLETLKLSYENTRNFELQYQKQSLSHKEVANELSLLESKQQQLEDKLQALRSDQEKASESYQFFVEKYNLKTDDRPEKFGKRKADYDDQSQKREKLKSAIDLDKERLATINQHVEEIAIQQAAQQQAVDAKKEVLTDAQNTRKEWFGEVDVKAAQIQLDNKYRQRQEELYTAKSQKENLTVQWENMQLQSNEKEEQYQAYTTVHHQLVAKWTTTMTRAGFTAKTEIQTRIMPLEEVQKIKQQQQQIDQKVIALHTNIHNAKEALAKAQLDIEGDEDEAQIVQNMKQFEREYDEILVEKGKIEHRLKEDEKAKIKVANFREQIEKQEKEYSRWAKLNEIIGQKDGKKFRQFAQGITLARLLQNANKYLENLNSRYCLRKVKNKDLEIEMVDNWQAGNHRSVATLSGGESFLVSLALALGLSDMAGNNAKIHSLFIDEGFGSLDANSLDAAISTLENLQAIGKTIGVISHVNTLKERIGTQIQVIKSSKGVSQINMVP